MSHTIRRRRTHNRHERGRQHLPAVKRRPHAVRASKPQRSQDELGKLVTDHALVRWMERVVGIDLRAKFIEDMFTQARAELISTMAHGKVCVNDTNVVLAVYNGKVVTVAIKGQE